MNSTLRAYLELSRISNAPTVVSNALAGAALGARAFTTEPTAWSIAAPAIACTCFYTAGMALNDFIDRDIDAAERPQRPIPAGRVSAAGALAYASTLMTVGLALLLTVGALPFQLGLALVGCIILYDVLHSRTAWTVLLMGLCRGLVYVVAAASAGIALDASVLGPAAILVLYVAGFSLTARHEAVAFAAARGVACVRCAYPLARPDDTCPECGHREGGGRLRIRFHFSLLLPAVLLAAILFSPPELIGAKYRSNSDIAMMVTAGLTAGFLAAWLASATRLVELRPPKIGPAVLMWIAAIALYDTYLLLLTKSFVLAGIALAAFALTRALQRRIAGT
ncbi:MAG: UbiA family prenyltransferase [Phycisphaerae bacterium]|nr:UbiA family prenyltransferase [Phycisphaerae bacterium]